jgi:hypothetical protein
VTPSSYVEIHNHLYLLTFRVIVRVKSDGKGPEEEPLEVENGRKLLLDRKGIIQGLEVIADRELLPVHY